MREGMFKDKSPRSGRVLFFLCLFILLFLWSAPCLQRFKRTEMRQGQNAVHSEDAYIDPGGVDKAVL